MHRPPPDPTQAPVLPLFVGPKNCEQVIGTNWRWTRDHARRLGVRILRIGDKPLIPAAELVAALEADGSMPQPEPEAQAPETYDAMIASLGLQRVGGP